MKKLNSVLCLTVMGLSVSSLMNSQAMANEASLSAVDVVAQSSPITITAADLPRIIDNNYPQGGPELVTLVCDIVINDPNLVDDVIDYARGANRLQRKAIAEGLGCAARVLAATRPAASDKIAQAVLNFDDEEFQTAFNDALDDIATAGISPGTGGGPVNRAFNFSPGTSGGGAPLASDN
jgi:hypothetical protein